MRHLSGPGQLFGCIILIYIYIFIFLSADIHAVFGTKFSVQSCAPAMPHKESAGGTVRYVPQIPLAFCRPIPRVVPPPKRRIVEHQACVAPDRVVPRPSMAPELKNQQKWQKDDDSGFEYIKEEPLDDTVCQWKHLNRKWEDEKTQKLNELAWSERSCREVNNDEVIGEGADGADHNEETIKMTKWILKKYCGGPPVYKSWKQRNRRSQRGRANANRELGDRRDHCKVDIQQLRYSQLSCKETFQCGRSISQLIQDLLNRKVSISAPFLRLTVFETIDEYTNEPILRCIDNRRLFALKEYAKKSGKDRLMVNVSYFNHNTLTQVQRFIQNSDDTDGRDVTLRKSRKNRGRNQNLQQGSSKRMRT